MYSTLFIIFTMLCSMYPPQIKLVTPIWGFMPLTIISTFPITPSFWEPLFYFVSLTSVLDST